VCAMITRTSRSLLSGKLIAQMKVLKLSTINLNLKHKKIRIKSSAQQLFTSLFAPLRAMMINEMRRNIKRNFEANVCQNRTLKIRTCSGTWRSRVRNSSGMLIFSRLSIYLSKAIEAYKFPTHKALSPLQPIKIHITSHFCTFLILKIREENFRRRKPKRPSRQRPVPVSVLVPGSIDRRQLNLPKKKASLELKQDMWLCRTAVLWLTTYANSPS
jgi:hypothetical protein